MIYSGVLFLEVVVTLAASQPKVDVYSIRQTNVWPPGYNVKLMADVKTHDNSTVVKWIFQSQFSNTTRYIDTSENHKKYSGSTLRYPSLLIWNLTYSDSGQYRCTAIHIDGTTESQKAIHVVVKDVPMVKIEQTAYQAAFGKSVQMKCQIRSIRWPVLSVFWERHVSGGSSILHSGLSGILGASIDHPSLTINYVSVADAGTYKCCATNKIGIGKSIEAYLTVIGDVPIVSQSYSTYLEVLYGTTVTINITVESEPSLLEVYWTFKTNDKVIKIKPGTVGMNGGNMNTPSLTILHPTKFHIGIYICYATNLLGTTHSKNIHLNVIGDIPNAGIIHDEYLTYFGSNITLHCHVTGTPKPTDVYWERSVNNGSKIIRSDTAGIHGSTLESPSLTILYVTTLDTGMYMCHAVNLVGIGRSRQIKLQVAGALPNVSIRNAMYITVYGQMVTLDCSITADPPATMVYWIKNKNGLNFTLSVGSIGVLGSTVETPSLTINNPAKSDAGVYWCIAINAIGHGSSLSLSLIVIGDIPQVLIATDLYFANYGYEHTMECFVNATPEHTYVIWKHEVSGVVRTINEATTGVQGASVDVPSLTITTVTTSDIGFYTCMAKNYVGIGSSQPIELLVNGGIPEVFIGLPKYTIKRGEGVTLLCTVKANPKHVLVYWKKIFEDSSVILKQGATGIDGITIVTPSLTLRTTDISDSGEYTCYATNEIGTGRSRSIILTVYKEDNTDLKNEVPGSDSKDNETWNIVSKVFGVIAAVAVVVGTIVAIVALIRKCRQHNSRSRLDHQRLPGVLRNSEMDIETSRGVSCDENDETDSTQIHTISDCVNDDSFI
ncbi:hemicentin-2-like isoform X1 [Mytilus californianus]|uniref:hemicentin-2-like isoform X1 n=1 Tax=Mytilus californianus TaxID=6549 RepID=UPI00224839C9|nr:hemicentin-2-like isoform X1 [Mytilus californianus]